MTVITLDKKLASDPLLQTDNTDQIKRLVNRCKTKEDNKDWQAKTRTTFEEIHAHSIPSDAHQYHSNYLEYLETSYSTHQRIVLGPHHFWYTILAEIAQSVVGNPELNRPLFTRDPKNKIDIVVPCADETEPLRMDALLEAMWGYVPVDPELFMPVFTTNTENSRLACLAAFLETCSPYYSYAMKLCGFPAIRLDGTMDDWAHLNSCLLGLYDEFNRIGNEVVAKWLKETVMPVAFRLYGIICGGGKNDASWLSNIFTSERCGSGSETLVDGWFSRLFLTQPRGMRQACNFPPQISRVPYTTYPSYTKWDHCFLLSHSRLDEGFMDPDFSWVQIRKLAEPKVVPYDPYSSVQLVFPPTKTITGSFK